MNPKIKLIAGLWLADYGVVEICRRMGITKEYLSELMETEEFKSYTEPEQPEDALNPREVDTEVQLLTDEEKVFAIDSMSFDAIREMHKLMMTAKSEHTRYKAAEWILNKQKAIQEMMDRHEQRIEHVFMMGNQEAEALKRFSDEAKDLDAWLDKVTSVMPDQIKEDE